MKNKIKSDLVKERISITILPSINTMLSKICKSTGKSKSFLVEKAIKDLVKKQLDKDTKILAKMKFDDLPSEDEWLSIQSNIN